MNKVLEKITLFGIFLIPVIPLVVTDYLFFPYISGKNFLFRIIVEIIFIAWLILAMRDPNFRPKKSALLICSALFIIFMAISASVGDVPSKSFWSNFERMEGVVGYLHVFLFMFVSACSLTKERFRTFFHINIGVATVVAFYGGLQHFGVFLISQNSIRVDATLGNPIYMAAYMLLVFFIALFLLLEKDGETNYRSAKITLLASTNVMAVYLLFIMSKVAEGNGIKVFLAIVGCVIIDLFFLFFKKKLEFNKTKVVSTIYTLLSLLFACLLYLTQTRGALIGLVAGLLFLAIFLSALSSGNTRKWSLGSLVALIILGGVFFSVKDQPFIKNFPTLNRLASISMSNTTTSARITIWGMALEGFKEHSILGWGNENFNLVFNKYYKPELVKSEQWFDRSHNILLDWLIHTGLVGFILYLFLFGTAIYYLFRKDSNFSLKEKGALTALFIAYMVQNLFVFDNISGIMLFASLLAYIYARNFENKKVEPKVINTQAVNLIAVVAVIGLAVSLYYVNVKPIKVAYALNQATILSAQGKHAEALKKYQDVIASNTFGTREAREHLMLSSQRALGDPNTSNEVNQAFLDESAKQMQNQIKEFPGDLRNYVLLGSYLKAYRLNDQAIIFLEEAKKLSPKKQAVYQILADIYISQGKFDQAITEAKMAYDFYPESNESALILSIVYLVSGDSKSADELLLKQFGTVYAYDPRLLNIYANNKDTERIIGVWQQYIKDNPEDLLGFMSLYQVYLEVGNKEQALVNLDKAIGIREKMVDDDPKNVDKIIALSDLYIKKGDLVKARQAIEKATTLTEAYIKKHKKDFRARLSLASFYMVLGRKEDAITILQKALQIKGAPKDEINSYIQTIAKGENPWSQ